MDVNTPEKIPNKQKKATRAQVEKDKEDSGILHRRKGEEGTASDVLEGGLTMSHSV